MMTIILFIYKKQKLKKLIFGINLFIFQLQEAVLLFENSVKEGGFKFVLSEMAYLYRILIHECAKVGHVKMAYGLFTQMKKRGIYVTDTIYTSVINAIANSPWDAEENLERMRKIRLGMETKGYLPNIVNFHAMIKG